MDGDSRCDEPRGVPPDTTIGAGSCRHDWEAQPGVDSASRWASRVCQFAQSCRHSLCVSGEHAHLLFPNLQRRREIASPGGPLGKLLRPTR